MKMIAITGAVLTVGLAGALFAHTGATGVVKERMDGMAAMGKAVKAVAPIMRGQVEYDAERVRIFAEEVRIHSGEAMTSLFPEGSGGMPSEAKLSVWADWEDFEELARQLHMLSEGLALAADNGVMGFAGTGNAGSMMGTGTMMGSGAMMDGGMMAEIGNIGLEELSEMPADGVFTMISQTCSACHTKYRAESN